MSADAHTHKVGLESSEVSESVAERKHTINVTVLYFAAASTATGLASESIELPLPPPPSFTSTVTNQIDTDDDGPGKGFPLSALASFLSHRHPNTNLDKILLTSRWSVDAEMVDDPENVFLKGGEEVAVICPVSGG